MCIASVNVHMSELCHQNTELDPRHGANVMIEELSIFILPMSFSQSRVRRNLSHNHTTSVYNPESDSAKII